MNKEENIPKVLRITVDERIAEDLIRLEICRLKKVKESGEFKDEPEFWTDTTEEGLEIVARAIDVESKHKECSYVALMAIPEKLQKKYPWKNLKEGQVFLSGAFKIEDGECAARKIKKYYIQYDEQNFEQIDDDVKENTKTLYYNVLAKGEENGRL